MSGPGTEAASLFRPLARTGLLYVCNVWLVALSPALSFVPPRSYVTVQARFLWLL